MPFSGCPTRERLWALATIPGEMSFFERFPIRFHMRRCEGCQKVTAHLNGLWKSYFTPEPDITPSLMKVYRRLQNDETLILKGWKIGNFSQHRLDSWKSWMSQGWAFRGGVIALSLFAGLFVLFSPSPEGSIPVGSPVVAESQLKFSKVPMAQIRFEDEKETRVRYVRPELIKTIEFETMGSQR